MIRTEIFMEGVQLDISADISALFTYAIDDVRDFGSKNTNYSKTISLPGSGRNNAIFGHVFEFTGYNPYDPAGANIGLNFNAAKAAQCVVLVDGVQVFKGVLRLMEAVQVGEFRQFECAVFGELGGLMSAVGKKLLVGNTSSIDDLDFTAYNTTWTAANIVSSWNTVAGTGVYWPLVDYGNGTSNDIDYQYHAFRAALYLREYVDKIITKAGYTWDSAFLNTAFFKRCVIPHNEDKLYKIAMQLAGGVNTTPVNHFLRKNIFSTTALTDLLDVDTPFPTHTLNNFSINGGNNLFTYTAGASGTFYFNYYAEILNTGTAGSLTISVRKNGTTILSQTTSLANSTGTIFWNYFPTNNVLFTLATSDVITLHVSLTGVSSVITPIDMTLGTAQFYIRNTTGQASPAAYGDPIDMQMVIPKGVAQADLLTSVFKMFNLYVVEDKFKSKHLNIEPYVDFYDIGNPEDWTLKLDRSKEMRSKPMGELNARYFNFSYDKDSDFYNDDYQKKHGVGYGDRSYDAGLDFVQDKKDLKLIFAASPLIGHTGKDKYLTPMYKVDNGVAVPIGTKIRILQAKKLTCASYQILSGASVMSTQTVYGYAGHVDDPTNPAGADLNFGAPAEIYWSPSSPYSAPNLVNAFYSAYMAEITDKDSKLLTCFVRLSVVDIYNLDWSRPKIIDGQLWRLNKIIDYDAIEEGVTKVELLKIINLSY